MKKLLIGGILPMIVGLFAMAALSGCHKDFDGNGTETETPFSEKISRFGTGAKKGELLVKVSESVAEEVSVGMTRSEGTRSGVSTLDAALQDIGAVAFEPVFDLETMDREAAYAAGLHRWYVVTFDEAVSLKDAAVRLAEVGEVSNVELNGQVARVKHNVTPAGPVRPSTRADEKWNDPRLNMQWHYHNTGDETICKPIAAGADVNANPAWDICAGDPSIIVAIMDEGVVFSHEDLADNMWTNPIELNGTPGVDDDGNRYIDDKYGYNFADNKGTITWGARQDEGHGTHVAGTVAAVNNNGIGVSGVAGGTGNKDGVRIMSIQIFGATNATGIGMAKGITYAADYNASILQCSYGAKSGEMANDEAFAEDVGELVLNAFNYFIDKPRPGSPLNGGIIVFSSGNNLQKESYPGAWPRFVCVTSFSADFSPSTFTNYGDRSDITAPGGDEEYYTYNPQNQGAVLSCLRPPDNYGYMSGTSMSAPHVSGVAALGLSYAKKLGRTYSPDEFKSLLIASVSDYDSHLDAAYPYTKPSAVAGQKEMLRSYQDNQDVWHNSPMILSDFKGKMGSGMVDAYRMLMNVRGTSAVNVAVGQEHTFSLKSFYGDATPTMTYALNVPEDVKERLGMTVTQDGDNVTISCSKQSAGIVTITSAVGGTDLSRELAIICRAKVASNGAWL